MTLALAVLAASLVGSPHCAGMCGPFVCFYAGTGAGARPVARWTAHAAYNGGRLLSYVALGALAGALGAGLDAAGRMAGLSRAAAVVAGALMVGWGLARLAAMRGVRVGVLGGPPAALRDALGAMLRRASGESPVARAAATGLLTTLLPCGWLYAFVVTAAGTGSAVGGMTVMLAFWAGTLPMLVAVGVGTQRLAGPLARRLPMASAVLLVVLGLATIAGKLRTDVSLGALLRDAPAAVTVPSAHAHDAHGSSAEGSHGGH